MQYPEEVKAIVALRTAFPNEGASTLAKRIGEGASAFESEEHKTHARVVGTRSYYSTYSVIRRYDAKQQAAAAKLAKTAKKALATV